MTPVPKWRALVLQASGRSFLPRAAGLTFQQSFHPGETATFGGRRGSVVDFGSALYGVPDELPVAPSQSECSAAFEHLAQILPLLRAAGASTFILHWHRRFVGRCTDEFSPAELRQLAALDCALFYVGEPVDGSGSPDRIAGP